MTKEEKIKEAWGMRSYLGSVIDENGWVSTKYLPEKQCVEFNNNTDLEYNIELGYRPKSLQGIDDNNGWIKIESEDDLPKEDVDCFYITKYSENIITGCFRLHSYKGWRNMFTVDHNIAVGLGHVTHYQPIVKPLKPIY